jgi:serine protease AprX
MLAIPLKSLPARLGLAAGASLVLIVSSLPGAAAAKPTRTQPGHIDEIVTQQAFAAPSSTVRVIITRDLRGNDDSDVRDRGGRVVQRLQLGNATVAEVPASQLAALAAQPGVVRIAYDAQVKIQGDPVEDCCDRLQSVYPLAVDAARHWDSDGKLRGTGIGVAVIDSGIRDSHPDFLGANLLDLSGKRVPQVLSGRLGWTGSGIDDSGHGTFVAGIIAGRGWGSAGLPDAGKYIGIAPDSRIISIKVSDSTGMAYVSDVISAIEWVAKHRQLYNIRIINLSMVSNMAGSYKTDMLDAAVELAWLQGLVVVVSVGNAGPNANITSPANDPYVISVGATDDRGTATVSDDALAAFSSYAVTGDGVSKPDLVAPGRNIVSTLSSRSDTLAMQYPSHVINDAYIRMSGTSAAAPIVTGVVAQLLQARPSLTPGEVKWLLTHTALPISGPGTGAGYPQVGAAVQRIGGGNANTGLVPNNYLAAAYAAKMGLAWDAVSWNTVAWDSVSWDTISWDSVSWNSVSWNSVSWNSVTWDTAAWVPAN